MSKWNENLGWVELNGFGEFFGDWLGVGGMLGEEVRRLVVKVIG